jgi:acyl-CoA synthetase (AMP-forming)/AMP-acid ligase II/acyl carrier protein
MRALLWPHILKHAQNQPEKIALNVPHVGILTYQALSQQIQQWSKAIADLNLPNQTRIGIFDVNALTLAPLGCAIVNQYTFVGIDHNIGFEAIHDYIKLMHIDVVLTQSQEAILSKLIEDSICSWYRVSMHDVKLHCLKEVIVKPYIQRSDVVGMIKTSGTTSTPKVIAVSEMMLKSQFDNYFNHFEVTKDDVFAQPINMSRPISFLLQSMRIWRWGCTLVYGAHLTLSEMINVIQESCVTRYTAPTFLIQAFNEHIKVNPLVLNHKLVIINLGSVLQPSHVDALQLNDNIKVVNSYGMSETGILTSTYAQKHIDIFSVGVDIGVGIKFIDNEICVTHPNYFSGYENVEDYELVDGIFKTGDIGSIDEFDNIHILGRVNEFINRGGDKISPYEVETKISQLFDIKDIAVFPKSSTKWTQEVACVVVTDHNITLPKIRESLKPYLSSFKMPTVLYQVDSIPRSTNGKIVRSTLHQFCEDKYKVDATSSSEFMSDIQEIVHKIWCEVLEVSNIAIDVDFISWGGDSFRFAQLVSALQNHFSISLNLAHMNEANTIETQSLLVEKSQKITWGILNKLKEGDSSLAPLVFFHDIAGNCEAYTYLLMHDFHNHPVYGINLTIDLIRSLDHIALKTITQSYANQILAQGFESVYLGGISSGGVFAYECAQFLHKQLKVRSVFMFDTFVDLHQRHKTKTGRLIALVHKHLRDLKTKNTLNKLMHLPRLGIKAIYRGYDLHFLETKRMKDLESYLQNQKGNLSEDQIPILIRRVIHGWTPTSCPIDVIYFYALNAANPHESYKRISPNVNSIHVIKIETHHSGFVSESFAHQSVYLLMNAIKEKACEL